MSSEFEVKIDGPGRLVCKESNYEYTFPFYEEDGQVIIFDTPTRRRLYLPFFSGWHVIPRNITLDEREGIQARLFEHFHRAGKRVRLFNNGDKSEQKFAFSPELFEQRAKASTLLQEAGFVWTHNYGSINVLHDKYGLEICGICDELDVKPIAEVMQNGFPQWHYQQVSDQCCGLEPGWTFSIFMFSKCSGGDKCEA